MELKRQRQKNYRNALENQIQEKYNGVYATYGNTSQYEGIAPNIGI